MSKGNPLSGGVEIAALKAKVVAQVNLMQPGSGTAWEDRGAIGLPKALILTCVRSMTEPMQQWEQIRRPETTGDARMLAFCTGALAGVSWVVHSLWWPRSSSPLLADVAHGYDVNWQLWALGSVLQMACAIAGMWLMLKLANAIYQKLLPHGVAAKIPAVLTFNLLAYSLGPVLLVFVPIVGWGIGLLWMALLIMKLGMNRLRIGSGAAIINTILTMLVTISIGVGIYFAGAFAWDSVTGGSVNPPPPVMLHPPLTP